MKKTFLYFFVAIFLVSQSVPTFAVSLSSTSEKSTVVDESATPAITSVKDALKQFKSLSRRERRDKLKDVKKEIKNFKAERKAGGDVSTNTLLLVILAILIPPLAVYLHEGAANTKFWINVVLTILGFVLFGAFGSIFLGSILGIIHALTVIL